MQRGESDKEVDAQPRPVAGGPQEVVDAYFQDVSSYWEDIYADEDVQGVVYQERLRRMLGWVTALGLPAGARALELGCGAGPMTVAMAGMGLRVHATDTVDAMVERARYAVIGAGHQERVTLALADAHALDLGTETFDLVVAVGVIPWLHSPSGAIAEMSRVLVPGGHLLVTSDNRLRLTYALDPRLNRGLRPLRRAVKRSIGSSGNLTNFAAGAIDPALFRPATIRRFLLDAGLTFEREETVGFGPLTFLAHELLPGERGRSVHKHLQALADRRVPALRWMGSHHLVLAQKVPEAW